MTDSQKLYAIYKKMNEIEDWAKEEIAEAEERNRFYAMNGMACSASTSAAERILEILKDLRSV
jgi:hypothetical protein